MRVLMKVTNANKQTDDKLLVQLQGQYGHASLILPIEQEKFVQVGDEWTLEHGEDGLHKIIGELDESFDDSQNAGVRVSVLSGETGSSNVGLDALAGKPQEP
jgi:flagellar basal body rod protein FlgF